MSLLKPLLKSNIVYLIIFSFLLISCSSTEYVEKSVYDSCMVELNNTKNSIKECPVIEEKECPVIEEKQCPVCKDSTNDMKIVAGEKQYETGLIYQRFADNDIEEFDDSYYDKAFDNCSVSIISAKDYINTANGFYGLANKEFKDIDNDIAKHYTIAIQQKIAYNDNLIAYLNVYQSFCDKYSDNDEDATPKELKDGKELEKKYIIHNENYNKELRIIEELKDR